MQREFVQIQLGPNRKDAGPTRARGQTRPPATLEIQWPVGEAGWQEQRDGSTEHGSDGWGIETTLEKVSKRCRHEFSNVKIGVGCLPSPSPVTSQHIREFCRPGTSWYLGTYPETRAIADSSPWCHSSRASEKVDHELDDSPQPPAFITTSSSLIRPEKCLVHSVSASLESGGCAARTAPRLPGGVPVPAQVLSQGT